jgi:hypothetical protein
MQNLLTVLSQIVIVPSDRNLVRMSGVLADLINKILSTRSPQITIRKLKVAFVLTPNDCRSIGKSVGLAMATHKLDGAEFAVSDAQEFFSLHPCRHPELCQAVQYVRC